MFKSSEDNKKRIKKFEGFVDKPTKDTDGNYTLGYGIRVDPKVRKSTTLEEAEKDFNNFVAQTEAELSRVITRKLSQPKQDALIDMAYNMGLTRMRKHGVVDLINAGKDAEAAALIKRLNKANVVETGGTVDLSDRANYRVSLWNTDDAQPSAQAQAQEVSAPIEATEEVQNDFLSELEGYKEKAPEDSSNDLMLELDQYSAPESQPNEGTQFDTATDISDVNELEKSKNVQALSKEFNVSPDVVEGMLLNEDKDTVRTKLAAPEIKKTSPATTRWASNPENNAILKKAPGYPQKVERATVKVNEQKPDFQKAIDSNFIRLEESALIGNMLLGNMNRSEGIKSLRELDKVKDANVINTPEMEVMKSAVSRLGSTVKDQWDKLANLPLGKDSVSNIFSIVKATAEAGLMTAEEFAAFIYTAGKDPGTYANFMIESSGGPIVAGAVGTAAGTPLAGAASVYAVGSVMAFGGRVREEMENYRDRNSGLVDYERFWSDAPMLARLRTEAVTYGLTIGAVETAFQFIGGKMFSKAIPKNPVMGAGGAILGGIASEGAGETLARTAGQAASGQEITMKENVAAGVEEAVVGGPMAGAGAIAQGAIQKAKTYVNAKKGAAKTTENLQKASKAAEDVQAMSELKETVKSNPIADEHPEQMADLIDESIDQVTPDIAVNPESESNPKSAVENVKEEMQLEANTGVVRITPSDWEAFNAYRGVDPFALINSFSPEVQAAYQTARETDSEVTIPMSEWIFSTKEDPDIDQIARINGNPYNVLEGNELVEQFEKDPLVFFDTDETADAAEDIAEEQIVYHGTPHEFDRFSTDYIGAGEGAQAYGHGLYFTEDKDVAEWYRKKLSAPRNVFVKDGKELEGEGLYYPEEALKDFWKESREFESAVGRVRVEKVKWNSKNTGVATVVSLDGAQRFEVRLSDLHPGRMTQEMQAEGWSYKEKKGQTYEVGIKANKNNTLDWDKPFAEQTEYVKKRLLSVLPTLEAEAFQNKLPFKPNWIDGGDVYQLLIEKEGSSQKASALLKDIGIPGVKYLTGGSRVDGRDARYNFVVFDDKFAKVRKKFYDTDGNESDVETENSELVEEPIEMTTVEGEDSTPLRPLNLTSPFETLEEQEAFDAFRRRFNRALPSKVAPELADDIAAILLRRFKLRSAIANLPINETLERLQFGRKLKQGKSRAYMPTLDKDFFTVAFNKDAAPEAVIHELAHVWLHEMAEDYVMMKDLDLNTVHGDVKAYREAMDTAAEVLGLSSLEEILTMESQAKLERLHETFAQTAEDYFLEGKSENSRIARTMDRMRQWLMKHFNALRQLMRKYPTLEINPRTEFLFDAMFAATKASEDEVYSMFPEPKFTREELGKSANKYLGALYDMRSKALLDTYSKTFIKKGLKENQRIFETEYARISKEAEKTVDAIPSMVLRQQMLDAYTDAKKNKGPETRISYESAKTYFTDGTEKAMDELKEQIPSFMITGKKKGGIDVPDLMYVLGINSAQDLKGMLLEANLREEMIQEEIDYRLKAEAQPLIKSEAEIHEIAEEAVNSAGRETIIKKEIEFLMSQRPNQFIAASAEVMNAPDALNKETRENYKNLALLQVGATRVYKFSASSFLRDMNRHRREATKAYKAKDIEKAIAKSLLEAQSFYLYQAAKDAVEQVAEARAQMTRLSKIARDMSRFRKDHDYDVIQFAVKTVKAVGKGEQVEPLLQEDLRPGTNLSQTNIDVINNVIKDLIGEPGGKGLTVNGSIKLGDVAKTLMKISQENMALKLADETLSLEEAVMQDLAEFGQGNVVEFKLKGQDNTSLLSAAKTSNTKLRAALDQMFKSTEAFSKSNLGKIFSWIGTQEAAKDVWTRDVLTKLREATDKFPTTLKEKVIASSRYDWMPLIPKSTSAIFWDSAKFKFDSMSDLLVAMLYMGSESGAKKFLYGKKLATKVDINTKVQEFWDMIADKYKKKEISKEHIQFVEKVWRLMDEIHPQVRDVLGETEGFEMGKIEGWKVNTPIGELKGGYFPVLHAKQISVDDFTKLLDGGSNLIDWVRAFPGKDTKMALERTEHYGDVNLNLNALQAYIQAAGNVIYLRKPLIAFSKYVNDPNIQKALDTRRPGMFQNMIKPWVERVKLQSYVDPSSKLNGLNPLMKLIRQNTGIQFFAGNFESMYRQTLGGFQALPEIGPMYMSLSAAEFASSPLTLFKRAQELSKVMQDRIQTSQTKFVSVMEDLNRHNDTIANSREAIETVTYAPLQFCQNLTDVLVWNAAYRKMVKKEMRALEGKKFTSVEAEKAAQEKAEKQAVAYADNVVKKTQGSSNISEMANLLYGSEATKFFTQFSTVPLINYELVTEAMRRKDVSPSVVAAMSATMLVAVLLPLSIDVLVTKKVFGNKEDEDEEKDSDSMGELVMRRGTGAMFESFFPVVGKYGGSAIAYGKPTFSPSARKVDDNTAKAIAGLQEAWKYGTELTPQQVRGVSEILGIATGTPLALYGKLEVYKYRKMPKNQKRILKTKRSIERRKAKAKRGEY